MITIKIFLASSQELAEERKNFEIFIYRKTKEWKNLFVFLELIIWEDFIDVMSQTRLQNEYDKAIKESDIFVMLFWSKVGKYTEEEFETAFHQFKETSRPFIITYFKDAELGAGMEKDASLLSFQQKLLDLGHFATNFKNTEWLLLHFNAQLEKLSGDNFDKFIRRDQLVIQQADNRYKSYNTLLTKKIIEAIKPYSTQAEVFFEAASKRNADWELQVPIRDVAQKIIKYSFVDVLGSQLRKILAIGKEDFSEIKKRKYIENCVMALKRALQLLCFALISKLWDYKIENELRLTPSQADVINQFFDDQFELNNDAYMALLQVLVNIFKDALIPLPISELEGFEQHLKPDSEFFIAADSIRKIAQLLENNEVIPPSVFEAEEHLTTILEKLAFLAGYKMVSVKSIVYDNMRNSQAYYIHNYVSLGIDSKSKVDSEKVNYTSAPVNTDVILLYKGEYNDSINLFPFIIDVNALTFEGGVLICFYTCREFSNDSLNYSVLEDNNPFNIGFTDVKKSVPDINDLMFDIQKRKSLKLDTVYELFQQAKKTILK